MAFDKDAFISALDSMSVMELNDLVKAIGARTGARGGGKPHMAQAGFANRDALVSAMPIAAEIVETALSNGVA